MREYQALPLFAGRSRSQLRRVSRAGTRLSVCAGTELVRQGDLGRQFVIVMVGTAEVWRDGVLIDEIGPGNYFGETTLLGEPASIVARHAMTVDVVAAPEFAALDADLGLVRRRIDDELDRLPWMRTSASDTRPPLLQPLSRSGCRHRRRLLGA